MTGNDQADFLWFWRLGEWVFLDDLLGSPKKYICHGVMRSNRSTVNNLFAIYLSIAWIVTFSHRTVTLTFGTQTQMEWDYFFSKLTFTDSDRSSKDAF